MDERLRFVARLLDGETTWTRNTVLLVRAATSAGVEPTNQASASAVSVTASSAG